MRGAPCAFTVLTLKDGWQERFLAALSRSPNIAKAAKRAGVTRQAAYYQREHDEEFRQRWDEIQEAALDLLEETAHKRARIGSDRLLMYLLSSHRRDVYGEEVRVAGKGGGPVTLQVRWGDADEDGESDPPSG